MPSPRSTIGLCIASSLLTLLIVWASSNPVQLVIQKEASENGPILMPMPEAEPTFYQLAALAGTDKVNFHHYECQYEQGLAAYRHQPKLKMLEIGLGCNMAYGPGKSFDLWTSYFEDVQMYFLEFNKECGVTWLNNVANSENVTSGREHLPIMSYGDQADREFLRKMAESHGPWDIIVDDGGHEMAQIINSFEELFPYISPGGTYFIEDLACSFGPACGGTSSGLTEGKNRTAINLVAEVFASSILNDGLGAKLNQLTCCDEMCALRTKKD